MAGTGSSVSYLIQVISTYHTKVHAKENQRREAIRGKTLMLSSIAHGSLWSLPMEQTSFFDIGPK